MWEMDQEEVSKVSVEQRSKRGAMQRLEKRLRRLQERLDGPVDVSRKERQHFSITRSSKKDDSLDWLMQVIRGSQNISWTEKMNLRPLDTAELLSKVASGFPKERKQAAALLGKMRGILD